MNDKVNELYQKLKTGLAVFKESDRYREFLSFSTRFHNYSFGNAVLIWIRKPDATRVAGFRTWQSMGRYVKAGERGIPIFVPMLYKKKADPAICTEEEQDTEEVLRGFRIGYVFDISQTDGKALPELTKQLPNTEEGEALFQKIAGISPVPVTEENMQMNGYYHIEEKKIVLKQGLPSEQKTKTCIHEIAHAMMHNNEMTNELSREAQELVAESVAFVVCGHLGLDSSDYSFGYLASWKGDEVKMEMIGAVVQEITIGIIGKITNKL